MTLFIGEDRIQDFLWVQKTLSEKTPPVTMEIKGLNRPEGAMSATFIRQLALQGNLNQFRLEMEKTGLDETSILKLYQEIREKSNVKGGKTQKRRKGKRKTIKRKTIKRKTIKRKTLNK
jgi:hypothetical protein